MHSHPGKQHLYLSSQSRSKDRLMSVNTPPQFRLLSNHFNSTLTVIFSGLVLPVIFSLEQICPHTDTKSVFSLRRKNPLFVLTLCCCIIFVGFQLTNVENVHYNVPQPKLMIFELLVLLYHQDVTHRYSAHCHM